MMDEYTGRAPEIAEIAVGRRTRERWLVDCTRGLLEDRGYDIVAWRVVRGGAAVARLAADWMWRLGAHGEHGYDPDRSEARLRRGGSQPVGHSYVWHAPPGG